LPEVIELLQNATSSPTTPSSSSTQKPNLVPVYIEIPADLLTPVAAYLKVAHDSEHSFLLESIVGGENLGRYSFVGAGASGKSKALIQTRSKLYGQARALTRKEIPWRRSRRSLNLTVM
jgi:anthranilate/para-aminobenzoate synthase component I